MDLLPRLKNGWDKLIKWMIQSKVLHESFEIGILLKAINGIIELVSGALLIFINPHRLHLILVYLTQNGIDNQPRDFISNFLFNWTKGFTISSQHFGVFYLLSHGFIKLILVWFLFRKKLWAYPFSIGVLILFISYQVYRYTYTHSVWLIILSLFDLLIIILAIIEYQRIKWASRNNQLKKS
jgi:uncharacterized membrane protein